MEGKKLDITPKQAGLLLLSFKRYLKARKYVL
jgi:hypothetical protein